MRTCPATGPVSSRQVVNPAYQNYKEGIVTRGRPAFDPVATITGTPAGEPSQVR
jgi:hypothetical protein